MKKLLAVSAAAEMTIGIALLTVPAWVASVLLGVPLDDRAGLVAAMLLYDVAGFTVLIWARLGSGMTGVGLLPVAALHAGMAAWCIACLLSTGGREVAT